MTPEEKIEIEKAVIQLVEVDFHGNFEPIHAAAGPVIGTFIPQASEEIRNALSHAAIALTSATINDARLNLARSKKHLVYGKYVCLFLAATQDKRSADAYINTLEDRDRRRFNQLRRWKDDLDQEWGNFTPYKISQKPTLEEVERDIEDIKLANIKLERLFALSSLLHERLLNSHSAPGLSLVSRISVKLWRTVEWFTSRLYKIIFWGLVIHIIGTLIYALTIEDREDNIRDFLTRAWELVSHHNSSVSIAPPAPTEVNPPAPNSAEPTQPASGGPSAPEVPIPAPK
jgi:hypothetical protein